MRILLVEDDRELSLAVCGYLKAKAFVVDVVASVRAARGALASTDYDAVLLDLHLEDGDGLALMPYLRRRADGPVVIVLTARDKVSERIKGLDAGADDYLTKPYDPAELLARLRAVGRRRDSGAPAVIDWRGLRIDLNREQVLKSGKPVALTLKEWALLRMLATRPDRVHRKLGRAQIQTVRGVGYRMASEGDAA